MAQQFRALTTPAESQLPVTPVPDKPLQVPATHKVHIPTHRQILSQADVS